MGAYMYPIKIHREKINVQTEEVVILDGPYLSLSILQFVGDSLFDAEERPGVGYKITVYRNREETNKELSVRIAKQEAYMAEYNKRHPKKE